MRDLAVHGIAETSVKELMGEVIELDALIIDCKPEEMLEYLKNRETFTLWWD